MFIMPRKHSSSGSHSPPPGFKYYYYDPSEIAAIIFIVLFGITTVVHVLQMTRTRTWFMIPFCVGGVFEIVGYVGRVLSHNQYPNFTLVPYTIQTVLLLIAPPLFCASIYMELARIVLVVDGDDALFIRRRWLTRNFVVGDVLCFFLQAAGGGMLAMNGNGPKIGKYATIIALVLQCVFLAIFALSAGIFHNRIVNRPTVKCRHIPYQRHLISLYVVCSLVFVRCIMRLVEYGQGWQGYVMGHEVFLYLFDAVPMFSVTVVMLWTHPSEIAALVRGHGKIVDRIVFTRELESQYKAADEISLAQETGYAGNRSSTPEPYGQRPLSPAPTAYRDARTPSPSFGGRRLSPSDAYGA